MLFVSVFIITSCGNGGTVKSIEYGDNLKEAIDSFEEKRKNFSEDVTDIVEDTDEKLSKKKPDLEDIATNWEKEWKDIHEEFQKLEEDFSEIGIHSLSYFDELKRIISEIRDTSLRKSEFAKNEELKKRWTIHFEEAEYNIEQVRNLLKSGNDFQRVLLAAHMRQQIEIDIEDLKQISARAKELLANLEKFTIEGKRLIAG